MNLSRFALSRQLIHLVIIRLVQISQAAIHHTFLSVPTRSSHTPKTREFLELHNSDIAKPPTLENSD